MAAAAAAAAAAAVDLITFVRTAGEGRVIGADVPLLSLPVRKRVSVLKAVLEAPKVGTLPPIVAGPDLVFEQAAIDAGSANMARAACYALAVDESVYCGSSINVAVERTTTHAIALGAGGNKGLAAILSRYTVHVTDHADRAAATSGGLIFGANEYHPAKIAQLCEGTELTMRLVDFLVRFGEQHALNLLMNHGSHLKMLNSHISGFSQGTQAHAVANGAPRPARDALSCTRSSALPHRVKPHAQRNAPVLASRQHRSTKPLRGGRTSSAPRSKKRARRSTGLKRVRSSRNALADETPHLQRAVLDKRLQHRSQRAPPHSLAPFPRSRHDQP